MKLLWVLPIVFIVILSGCVKNTPTPKIIGDSSGSEISTVLPEALTILPTSSQIAITPISEITITRTPTPIPTPTLLIVPEGYYQSSISNPIRLCTDDREVQLDQLGIDTHIRLVLLPQGQDIHEEIESSYWILSPTELEPQHISILEPGEGIIRRGYEISPGGKHILYSQREVNAESQTVWVSTLNGEHSWQIGEIGLYAYAEWVSENEIVIIGIEDEPWTRPESPPGTAYIPLLSINPITLEQQTLSALPEGYGDRYFYYYFRWDDIPHTLYYTFNEYGVHYEIYDYSSLSSHSAFQWMETITERYNPDVWMNDRIWQLADSTFMTTIFLSDGIEISPPLTLDLTTAPIDYDEIMYPINLAENYGPQSIWGVSPSGELLALVNLVDTSDLDFDEWLLVDYGFYILNTKTMMLVDYCLKTDIGTDLSISPDGRFAALTYYENPSTQNGRSWLIVINLETGYFTRIDSYQMIGWGEIN